jgi:hypothetical protein
LALLLTGISARSGKAATRFLVGIASDASDEAELPHVIAN